MRPIWSGGISFGLIYIPINLYSIAESVSIDFDLIRKKDQEPIGYAKIVKSTGEVVDNDEIIRGYQYSKGKYVSIENEELEEANPKKTKSISIIGFIDINEVDPKLFEKPYILEPEGEAAKTYKLFHDALKNTKKAALGKFILRNRENLVIIIPEGRFLTMIQLRYASEIRDYSELKAPKDLKIEKEELEMAESIIKKLTKKFEPEKFKDEYTNEVMAMINEKVTHKKISKKSDKPKATKVTDLMKQLKASLKTA